MLNLKIDFYFCFCLNIKKLPFVYDLNISFPLLINEVNEFICWSSIIYAINSKKKRKKRRTNFHSSTQWGIFVSGIQMSYRHFTRMLVRFRPLFFVTDRFRPAYLSQGFNVMFFCVFLFFLSLLFSICNNFQYFMNVWFKLGNQGYPSDDLLWWLFYYWCSWRKKTKRNINSTQEFELMYSWTFVSP